MAGFSVSGLSTGLDINSLVSQLVAAEAQPAANRLNRREAALQTELSALGSFKSALSELKGAVTRLTKADTFTGLTANVGDSTLLSASAASNAQPGVYSVEVRQLAHSQKLASSAFAASTDTVGTGTLTIQLGSYDSDTNTFTPKPDSTPQTVTIDGSNDSLEGVRDAINEADMGVTATIVNDGSGYRLALASEATGEENSLQITVSDADGNHTDTSGLSQLAFDPTAAEDAGKNLIQTVAAKDVIAIIDGLTVTSAGNTLDEAIQGVTLNLQSADPGTTTTVNVKRDTGAVTTAVNGFVEAYNQFLSTTSSLTAYDPQTRRGGPLLGDSTARSVTSQLRRILGDAVAGGDFSMLSDLGISTERNGSLKLDSGKLKAAVEDDPDAVAALFTQSGDDDSGPAGIAERVEGFLSNLLESGGPLDSRTKTLNQGIDRIGEQRIVLGRRLEALESRYFAQFNAMEHLVSQLTATGNFLNQQLANLPGFDSIRRDNDN